MYQSLRVLVAEDDASLLELIAAWLEGLGASVVRAATGSDLVLKLVEQGPFELVITDIAMPWMDGLEAMRSVRHGGVMPPVLFITGSGDRAIDRRVTELGEAAALLRKPIQQDDLQAAVDRLLDARSRRR